MTFPKLPLTIAVLAAIALAALHANTPPRDYPAPAGAAGATPVNPAPTYQNPAAAGSAAPLPGRMLTVVKNDGTKTDTPGMAVHDFGTLSLARTEPIQFDFALRNDGAAVTLDHMQAACGCTTAVADGILPGEEIAAGKTLTIHVAIDPGHLGPGPANKMVWVYIKGQPAPAATLEMMGTMTPLVAFSPSLLDFGKVDAGQEKSLLLTVTGDASLLATLPAPTLSPPVAGVSFVREKKLRQEKDGKSSEDYHVVLTKEARIGQIQSMIGFPSPSAQNSRLASAYASLVGEVSGEISASPSTIAFGSVGSGKSAVQQIIVTGDAKVLNKSTVRGASPYVTAKLVAAPYPPAQNSGNGQSSPTVAIVSEPGGKPAPAQATLEVTLSGQAPAGVLQTEVVVTTPSGQQLALHVWAFIEGKSAVR